MVSCRQGRSSPGSSWSLTCAPLAPPCSVHPSPPCRLSQLCTIAYKTHSSTGGRSTHPRPSGPARLPWSPSSKPRPPNLGQWAGVHPFSLSPARPGLNRPLAKNSRWQGLVKLLAQGGFTQRTELKARDLGLGVAHMPSWEYRQRLPASPAAKSTTWSCSSSPALAPSRMISAFYTRPHFLGGLGRITTPAGTPAGVWPSTRQCRQQHETCSL